MSEEKKGARRCNHCGRILPANYSGRKTCQSVLKWLQDNGKTHVASEWGVAALACESKRLASELAHNEESLDAWLRKLLHVSGVVKKYRDRVKKLRKQLGEKQ